MDRQAIARRRRADQVSELLADERAREQALQEELEERIAEADGPALDEEVFARMSPEEADLVRDRLVVSLDDGDDLPEEESFWDEDEAPAEPGSELEGEIARLEEEVALCRRRQEAYRRYLELLGG